MIILKFVGRQLAHTCFINGPVGAVQASQDLDEVLMSLAGLQLAYEGSTPYTHNTNKTLKALRGLQKQYATASQGGSSQGAGGSLNYVIEVGLSCLSPYICI